MKCDRKKVKNKDEKMDEIREGSREENRVLGLKDRGWRISGK